ncbi:hypothetical protein LX82_01582 [Celeribacter halophilus]|uniref:Uncharacterized protein n=1 Tax=Celeribacter halophilus TaxID=576117 RepID=A0A1I3SY97_9RHOB|nr:hypothetical protein LX82_01582 [Celeribacter halophilus]SFJ63353.1 hypothetical protein SAMN04488138_107134 [Celeribacter halophilus]
MSRTLIKKKAFRLNIGRISDNAGFWPCSFTGGLIAYSGRIREKGAV